MSSPLFAPEHLHPLMVHFPIALFLIAPVFIVVALLARGAGRWFALASLILLSLGTVGAWVAVASGDAAENAASLTTQAKAVLERHEELGEVAATTFSVLTAVLAAIVLVPLMIKRLDRPNWTRTALSTFLVLLVAGDLVIAKAAHEGGRLVHEFGTSAPLVRTASR